MIRQQNIPYPKLQTDKMSQNDLFCHTGSNSVSVVSSSAGLEVQIYETIDKYHNHNVGNARQHNESPYEIINDTPLRKPIVAGKNKGSAVEDVSSKEGTNIDPQDRSSSANEDYYTIMNPAGVGIHHI